MSGLSLLSLGAAGLLGAVAAQRFGWALAMGYAILTGNTEPLRPELPYPWWLSIALLVGSFACHRWARRSEEYKVHALIFGHLLVIVAALMPFWHIWKLSLQT